MAKLETALLFMSFFIWPYHQLTSGKRSLTFLLTVWKRVLINLIFLFLNWCQCYFECHRFVCNFKSCSKIGLYALCSINICMTDTSTQFPFGILGQMRQRAEIYYIIFSSPFAEDFLFFSLVWWATEPNDRSIQWHMCCHSSHCRGECI